jgi:hypothetical protein
MNSEMDSDPRALEAYVRAALTLHGYRLDEETTVAVILQFSRIAGIAGALLQEPIPPMTEPLPVFRP